jgi:transposase
MHKALEQINLQLHKTLSDVTGVTDMKILRVIVEGPRDPMVLARMRHPSVHSSEETIVKALTGDWRAEDLFMLRQALELYDVYQQKTQACDREIETYMKTLESRADPKDLPQKPRSPRRKNQTHFDLRQQFYQWSGVELTTIDLIDAMTAQTVLCEIGIDMNRFATEKHCSLWLGVCPNQEITGGQGPQKPDPKGPQSGRPGPASGGPEPPPQQDRLGGLLPSNACPPGPGQGDHGDRS